VRTEHTRCKCCFNRCAITITEENGEINVTGNICENACRYALKYIKELYEKEMTEE